MDPPNVLWFAGAYAVVVASYVLLGTLPASHSSFWIMSAALGLLLLYSGSAWFLLRGSWWVPGGLAAALAVAMFPAVAIAFLRLVDTWSSDFPFTAYNPSAVGVSLATAAVALLGYGLTRFSFLFMLVVGAAVVAGQFLAPVGTEPPSSDDRAAAALITGGLLVVLGIFLDAFGRRQEAFWFHAGGWFGAGAGLVLFVFESNGDPNRGWIPMLVVGAILLAVSGPIRRATWAVYGVLGYYAPLVHYLLDSLNENDWVFALALLGVGLSIFAAGMVQYRFGRAWAERFVRRPPPGVLPNP
jgi:hypothetical protein